MRSYEHEIIKTLNANGGCIERFNKLAKQGNFHTTTLIKHLKSMQKWHLIEVTKSNKQRKRYCVFKQDFAKLMKNVMKDFKPIENDLRRKDLSNDERIHLIQNDIRLAFYKFNTYTVGWLNRKYVDPDEKNKKTIEKLNVVLWNRIQKKLQLLSKGEKIRVLNTLFTASPLMFSLEDYRRMQQ